MSFFPPTSNNININTSSHPIIERVQNFNLDRKLLSIHSSDRDIKSWPFSHEFNIRCPQPYINIQSMRIVEINLPAMYFNFSRAKQNTKFYIQLTNGSYPGKYLITIPDGFYNPTTLQNSLEFIMNRIIREENSLPNITDYNYFKVFYNEVTQTFSFGNEKDSFDLLFDEEITYTLDCCVNGRKQQVEPCGRLTSVFYNPVKWGFPYYIGYDRKKYSSNTGTKNLYIEYVKPEYVSTNIWLTNSNGTNYSILGENVFTFLQSETIYLELDKWNNYDELDMDSQNPNNDFNSNSTYNNKQNGRVNTAFAKIPTTIYPPGQQFDSRNGLLQNMAYFDPVIERIQEFKFKFRYHDGTPVWFGDIDFNFTIEINQLRNEIPKKFNVNTPSSFRL